VILTGAVLARSLGCRLPAGARRRLRAVTVLAASLAASLVVAAPFPAARAEGAAIELLGSWYVLVHYRDGSSENPDADRWDDRIWVFAMKGSRLQWTEYPIVVFRDETGRFENLSGDRRQKVLEAWEPNEAQLGEIRAGLEINIRGSRSKTLRGNPVRGYQSAGAMNSQSASVIGYSEAWAIEELSSLPVFSRRDSMGSGRSETLEGYTEYASTRVLGSGALLEGRYQRDGIRSGSFRMMRSAEVAQVGNKRRKPATP
jgi:hypothetical protein